MPEHAAGIESVVLRDVLDNVGADPYLDPIETQVALTTTAERDVFTCYVESPGLTRRLLLYPEFTVTELRVTGEDQFGASVAPQQYESGVVTGVKGQLPIGAVKIPKTSRSTTRFAPIVSESVLANDPRKGGDDE